MQIKNVPNGWKIKKLKQVLSLLKDGTHGTHKDCAQGKFLLSAKDVVDGRVLCSEDSRIISDEDFNSIHAKYKLQNKDIVLTIVGTVGRSAIINDYNQEYTFQRSVAILRPNESILSEFLYDQIQSNNFQNELKKRQSVSAQPGVYLEDLGSLPCVVPPKEEQKKIAEILGTWDRAIEELTGLIAEKKELKRGLMQQLLTGTQRLPGFTKPWRKIKCADVLFERKTYLPKGKELEHVSLTKDGVVPKTARYERDFLVRAEEKEYKITKFNDICYNPANLKFGVICRNTYGDGIFSPIYVTFEIKNIDSVFLGFIVKTHMFQGRALRYEQGTVYERMAVSAEDLLKMKLEVPADLAEQKAIADVLSKADSEIDLLNQQLDVLKEQKRGLMQKLLTGEIRVKVDNE